MSYNEADCLFWFPPGGLTNMSISPDPSLCNSKVLSFLVRWNTKMSNDDYCNCCSICLPPPPLSPPKHPSLLPLFSIICHQQTFPEFSQQLCRAACYWFPWWVSKINIKVCDRRVAYWFKRSRCCSHNVSTVDLWPVFMFSDNTADCGCDGGWTEETVAHSLYHIQIVPSSFHPLNSQSPTTSDLRHETQSRRTFMVMT